jgi:LuxR family maltose regulon positive regulatory protein
MAGRKTDAGPEARVRGREVLYRVRLDTLFERALEHAVTTVVAGPGYGKTTAVVSYLRAAGIQTVWVQLSAHDNMPSHFWETFSQAFLPLNPDLTQTMLDMGFPDAINLQSYLAGMLEDELKPRFSYALVFDDLHLLESGPALDFIAQIARFSNKGVAVIAISRRDNFPIIPELSQRGGFSRIDESDLSFTKSELAEYFEMMDVAVSNNLTTDIYRETEGWPFAISLAAHILEQNPDDSVYIRTALRGTVSAIIDNDLFAVISEELKHFLVQISLVRHLPLELLDEFRDGRRLMHELASLSSLVRYDNYMHVYRIHQLLLHYLEGKQDMLTEEERLEVNKKAARWCVANGYKIDALAYYRAIGDFGAIIDIAYTYPPVIPFDVAFELLEIFEHAPADVFDRYSTARILHTRLIMSVGRVEDAVAKIREYIDLIESRPLDGPTSHTLMGLHNNLGFAKLITCPETRDYSFASHFEKALKYFSASSKLPPGGFRIYNVGPYALRTGSEEAGDPERYIEMVDRSVLCTTITLQGCGYGLDDLLRSEHAFFRCQLPEAEQYALRCLGPAHDHEQFEIECRALFLLIRVYLQKGKYDRIADALLHLGTLTEEKNFANRNFLHEVITSWFFASIGETDRMEGWLKSDLWSNDASDVFDGLDEAVRIKYYLATKNYQTLFDFINSRTPRYGISRYILGKIGRMAVPAVCLCHLGDRTRAFRYLREAYELASPNGFDMPFVELGNNMRTLTGAALKATGTGIPPSWLTAMHSRATTYAKRVAHVRSRYLYAHDLETTVHLTGKEIDILVDLSQGLSRVEISQAHNISANTVKSMLRMIYEKLGAESAMDAIRIATTRNLLH